MAARTVSEVVEETPHAKTIVLDVPGWPGHRAGQHVDVRLTAEDGYQAQRCYSIASAPEDAAPRADRRADRRRRGLAVPRRRAPRRRRARAARPDRRLLRLGRRSDGGPLLLIAGGSGLVPLMAMLRHRAAAASAVDARLLAVEPARWRTCSIATSSTLAAGDGLDVALHAHTQPPADWGGFARRIDAQMLTDGRDRSEPRAADLRMRPVRRSSSRRRSASSG